MTYDVGIRPSPEGAAPFLIHGISPDVSIWTMPVDMDYAGSKSEIPFISMVIA